MPPVFVLLVALPNINHVPSYDEVLHYVAALGYIDHGAPVVAQGEYPRAALYSMLVAMSFKLFGVSDFAARVPSVLASVFWALAVYTFVRSRVSRSAGWFTLLFLVSAPTFIQVTLMTRFYGLHALLIFLASILVYIASERSSLMERLLLSAAAAACLVPAFHLQATTVIAAAAVSAWIAFLCLPALIGYLRKNSVRAPIVVLALLGTAAVGMVAVVQLGLLDRLQSTAVWAASRAGSYNFYLGSMRNDFGFAWVIAPFLAVVSFGYKPKLTFFAATVFGVGFILHTIAAQKAARYAVYLLPYFALIAGIGVSQAIGVFAHACRAYLNDMSFRSISGTFVARSIVIFGVLFVILVNPGSASVIKGLVRSDKTSVAPIYEAIGDWQKALPVINDKLEPGTTLVVSSGVKSLFYLGYYNYELNVSVVRETRSGDEFGVDSRTGGRVIGSLSSLERVIACAPKGMILVDRSKWRVGSHVPSAVADFIEQNLVSIALPEDTQLLAFSWAGRVGLKSACNAVPASRASIPLPK